MLKRRVRASKLPSNSPTTRLLSAPSLAWTCPAIASPDAFPDSDPDPWDFEAFTVFVRSAAALRSANARLSVSTLAKMRPIAIIATNTVERDTRWLKPKIYSRPAIVILTPFSEGAEIAPHLFFFECGRSIIFITNKPEPDQ
jgi:hypothetical protein